MSRCPHAACRSCRNCFRGGEMEAAREILSAGPWRGGKTPGGTERGQSRDCGIEPTRSILDFSRAAIQWPGRFPRALPRRRFARDFLLLRCLVAPSRTWRDKRRARTTDSHRPHRRYAGTIVVLFRLFCGRGVDKARPRTARCLPVACPRTERGHGQFAVVACPWTDRGNARDCSLPVRVQNETVDADCPRSRTVCGRGRDRGLAVA